MNFQKIKNKKKLFKKIEEYILTKHIPFNTLYIIKIKKITNNYIYYTKKGPFIISIWKKEKLMINDIKNYKLKQKIYNYLRIKKLNKII